MYPTFRVGQLFVFMLFQLAIQTSPTSCFMKRANLNCIQWLGRKCPIKQCVHYKKHTYTYIYILIYDTIYLYMSPLGRAAHTCCSIVLGDVFLSVLASALGLMYSRIVPLDRLRDMHVHACAFTFWIWFSVSSWRW